MSVSQGEVRFIIGPNGAGKSTFFKLIIGYHNPDEGSIIYKDKNIEKLKLHERINLGMGVKFQAPSIFSELTVLQNLSLANNQKNALNLNDLLNDFSLDKEKNVADVFYQPLLFSIFGFVFLFLTLVLIGTRTEIRLRRTEALRLRKDSE